MALSTYLELQAAIATRLHRSDLTSSIVDYITIAEKRINRAVKLTAQELEATLTATIGSRVLTAPSLFNAPIELYLETYPPRYPLEFRLPTEMQVFTDNGLATEWTVDGTSISLNIPADLAYVFTLRYTADYNLAATSTNTLLTSYPDLYLYGSLIEAAGDIRDNDLMALSQKRYSEALQECLDSENSSRSIAYLTTELSGAGRSNILTGI